MKKLLLLLLLALLPLKVEAQPGPYSAQIQAALRNYPFSYASDPFTCDSTTAHTIYYNTASNVLKFCNGTSWLTISDTSAAGAIVIGTTPITGGTTTRMLYDLAGVVQEAANATIVAGVPTFVAPVLGAATFTSLSIGTLPANTQIHVQDAAQAKIDVESLATNNLSDLEVRAPTGVVGSLFGTGTTVGGTLGGVSRAGQFAIYGSGAGLTVLSLITGTSDPVTVSTNDTLRMTFGATGGVFVAANALTAATMTVETATDLRSGTSSYTWTNAMVVALGASTTGDIKVATLPAKTRVKNAYVIITGAGAGTTTLTVAFGRVSAGYIDYIVASDAQAAANTVYGDASAERGTNLTGYDLPSYTATTDVYCHFISTGSNLSAVTGSTGRVVIETELVP